MFKRLIPLLGMGASVAHMHNVLRGAEAPLPSPTLPPNHVEAGRQLVDTELIRSTRYRDYLPLDRQNNHPVLLDFTKAFMDETKALNIPMRPFYLYRDNELQERLKAKGRSKAGAGQSPHNHGCAVDFVHMSRLWEGMDKKHWDVLGAIGKEVARKRGIDVVWGGDWRFYDPAHWELANWRDWRAFRNRVGDDNYFAHLALMDGATKSQGWQRSFQKAP